MEWTAEDDPINLKRYWKKNRQGDKKKSTKIQLRRHHRSDGVYFPFFNSCLGGLLLHGSCIRVRLWHQFSEAHAECACSCTSSFLYFFHYSPPSTKALMHYPARSIVYCHSGSWMGWRTRATAGIVDAILANATPPSSSPLIHGTATIVGYCLRMNASSAYSGLRPTQAEFAYMSYWMVVSYLHDVRQNTRISGILLGRTGSCSFRLLWVEKISFLGKFH